MSVEVVFVLHDAINHAGAAVDFCFFTFFLGRSPSSTAFRLVPEPSSAGVKTDGVLSLVLLGDALVSSIDAALLALELAIIAVSRSLFDASLGFGFILVRFDLGTSTPEGRRNWFLIGCMLVEVTVVAREVEVDGGTVLDDRASTGLEGGEEADP